MEGHFYQVPLQAGANGTLVFTNLPLTDYAFAIVSRSNVAISNEVPVTGLYFQQQPTDNAVGALLTPPVTVAAANATGPVTNASITLSLASGTGANETER